MSKKKEDTIVVNNRSNTTFFNDSSLIDDDQNNYDEFNYDFNDQKTEAESKIDLCINIHKFLINYVSEFDNLKIIPLCEYLDFDRIKMHLEISNV